MKVADKKPVPVYSLICYECGSEIEYLAAEVSLCHLTCPVCGTSNWANTIRPKRFEESNMWRASQND